MTTPANDSGSERRRRSVLKYTVRAALAYHIPVIAAYLGCLLGLARYGYGDMAAIHVAILANSTFFILLVKRKHTITKRDVGVQLLVQITVWLGIVTAWFFVMDDLRILILFASVLALFFVFIQTNLVISLAAITIVATDYLIVAAVGINHFGQAGQLSRELLYVLVFVPVSGFVAYLASTLRQQHREIRKSEQERQLHVQHERAQQIELQALQEADRLKDDFLAKMSHELRTPLNSIIGGSTILKNKCDQIDPQLRKLLENIHASGLRLLASIDDILDLTVLADRELDVDLRPCDPRELTAEVLEQHRPDATAKGLELIDRLPSDLPLVLAAPARFQQILSTLVANAIKFTASGQVIVAVEVTDASAGESVGPGSGRAVAISVTDSGIGINEGDLDRIFRPFEQVDGSVSRRYEGTGLGLAIARQLVELHGGTLSVTSEPAAGSCFTVTFPAA